MARSCIPRVKFAQHAHRQHILRGRILYQLRIRVQTRRRRSSNLEYKSESHLAHPCECDGSRRNGRRRTERYFERTDVNCHGELVFSPPHSSPSHSFLALPQANLIVSSSRRIWRFQPSSKNLVSSFFQFFETRDCRLTTLSYFPQSGAS